MAVDLDEFKFKISDGASDVVAPDNRSRTKSLRLADMYTMDYATGELVRKKDAAGDTLEPNPEGGASTLPEALEPATKSITEEQMMDIVTILKPHYEESQRHYICLYLAGWMRKRGVKYEFARATVETLAKAGNDNELSDRIRAVSDQYDKNTDGTDKQEEGGADGAHQLIRYNTDIKGYNGLKEILEAQFMGDTGKAWRLLHEIDVRLPKKRVEKAESDKEREKRKRAERIPNAKDIIIRSCKEIFVDQHGVPHIAIWKDKSPDNPKDHYEVMNIKEDRDDVKGWINAVYHQDAKNKVIKRALELGFSEEEAKKMARTVGSLTKKEREDLYDWLRYEAKNSGVRHNLQIRIAGVDSTKDPNSAITSDLDDSLIDTIYYDLTNDDWEAIKITAKGWKIVKGDELPILFKRGANRAQIYPAPSGEYPADILDQYVALLNIRNPKHQNLFKKWFMSLYWPATIAKPAPMPYGSWGGGKTTIFETVKDVVDPSSVLTTAFPKQAMELIQLLDQEYLVFFDNMPEKISESRSDALSRILTGSGFVKRTLYENNKLERYNFTRVVGLNGISLSAKKADLLSRGLLFEISPLKDEIKRVDPEGRELKAVIWRKFQTLKAQLLAYMLDMMVRILERRRRYSLEEYYGANITKLPRMADWTLFCAVASEEMALAEGKPEDVVKKAAQEFIDQYYENINLQAKEAVEASPVAQCMIEMMDTQEYKTVPQSEEDFNPDDPPWWEGVSSHLLPELKTIAKSRDIETKGKSSGFPANPSSLGKKLRAIQASLASNNGIHIFFEDRPDHTARVICIVRKELLQYFLSTRRPVVTEESKRENASDTPAGDTAGENSPAVDKLQNPAQSGGLRQDDRTTGEITKVSAKMFDDGWLNGSVKASELLREPRLPDVINNCMQDKHGNSQDYFTAKDFVFNVIMLPNSHYTEDKAVEMLNKLRTHGLVIEFEPGKYRPVTGGAST